MCVYMYMHVGIYDMLMYACVCMWIWYICIYMDMYTDVYICVNMDIFGCICVHVGQTWVLSGFLICSQCYLFWDKFSFNLDIMDLARVAGHWTSVSVPYPQTTGTGLWTCTPIPSFMWVAEDLHLVPYVYTIRLTHWAISLASVVILF